MIRIPVLYSMMASHVVGLQAVVTADGYADDDGPDEAATTTSPSCYTAQYSTSDMVMRVGSGVELESDVLELCGADSTCLGYIHKTDGRYVLLEDGGLSCDEDFKVGYSWIVSIQTKSDCGVTTAVPSCYSLQYEISGKVQLKTFSAVQTEPDAQVLCDADSTCLGYLLKTNGQYVAIETSTSSDRDFKVGFNWVLSIQSKGACGGPAPAPSCYTPQYGVSGVQMKDFSGVEVESDAQTLCDADSTCMGYIHNADNLKYQAIVAGSCSSNTELKVGYNWIISIQTKGDCCVTPPAPSCYSPQYSASEVQIREFSGVNIESDAQALCNGDSTCLGYIHRTSGEYVAMEAGCASTDDDFKVGYSWIVSIQSKGACGGTPPPNCSYVEKSTLQNATLRIFSGAKTEADAQALCNSDNTCLGYIHKDLEVSANGFYTAIEAADGSGLASGVAECPEILSILSKDVCVASSN